MMKRKFFFLLCGAVMCFCCSAQAQTAPVVHPGKQPVKAAPRTKGTAAKSSAYKAPFKVDTAALRRSARPADGIRIRPYPKK